MKNSIVFIGIALVSVIDICNATNVVDKQTKFFQEKILAGSNFSIGGQIVKFYGINRDSIEIEIIERANKGKIEKTTDELFAEDNAITDNNISNETLALDFEIINRNSISDEVIESANLRKIEKTPEELIAEDNAITENNLSNETQALDFRKINRKSNIAIGKHKSIFGFRLKS